MVNGSGLSTTVNVTAGDTITFQYDLLTSSNTASPQDFAFYTLGGQAFLVKSQNQATNPSSDFYVPGFQTGTTPSFMGDITPNAPYHMFTTVTATTTGPLTFGVGVVNVGDTTVGTSLALDDIRLLHNGVSTQITAGANNGGFENPDTDPNTSDPTSTQDLYPYTVAGNVILQVPNGFGQLGPSEGTFYAFLSNTPASTTGGSFEPTDLNSLATALGTTAAQIQSVSDAVNPAVGTTVPLPTGLMIAPLGLALAGAFVMRARRTAAAC